MALPTGETEIPDHSTISPEGHQLLRAAIAREQRQYEPEAFCAKDFAWFTACVLLGAFAGGLLLGLFAISLNLF
jgi:hypothetical protein